jgi:energy-coupling factor transporter ATP-binding protein EcfA2
VDETTALDLLATALASQFVIFAGPSGTGKSTFARLLARFFAPEYKWRVLEARRGWVGPEDCVGYFSVLADYFATTPDTEKLIALHDASVEGVDEGGPPTLLTPPILVIEEINLSPPEGYLSPLFHGFSSPVAALVAWPLHARATGARDPDEFLELPRRVLLGPYFRCFGTINVDATAIAPARKVTARAATVLLEPSSPTVPDDVVRLLRLTVEKGESPGADGEFARFLGDPSSGFAFHDGPVQDACARSLGAWIDRMATETWTPAVSRRDWVRAMMYMGYFLLLAGDRVGLEEATSLAAENALLHFVLPGLPAERFSVALSELARATDLSPAPQSEDDLGGLLAPRLARLNESLAAFGIAEAVDFWTALS